MLKQRSWRLFGWDIMFTWGQSCGFGIFWGWGWTRLRVNGVDIMFGPAVLTIQPPPPKWLMAEIENPNEPATAGLIIGSQSPAKEWLRGA